MSAQLTIKIPVWLDLIFVSPLLAFRLLRYGYTYRRIYLGEGEWTILDLWDYYRLRDFNWYLNGTGVKYYAYRNYKTNRRKTAIRSMHRDITNAPDDLFVDHRNGNSLDNRKDNLRLATNSQNNCNSIIDKSKTTSRYRGVVVRKKYGRCFAQIRFQGKPHYLGSFDSEIDAAKAYDAAAKKQHGEFARLNFS
jgi:hypothetical protein